MKSYILSRSVRRSSLYFAIWLFVASAIAFGWSYAKDQPPFELSLTLPTKGGVTALAWAPDGKSLATVSGGGQSITIWAADGTRLRELPRLNAYVSRSLSFFGSGDFLLTPPKGDLSDEDQMAFTLWNTMTGAAIRNVEGPEQGKGRPYNHPMEYVISPDARMVATSWNYGPIRIYETSDWTIMRLIHPPSVWTVAPPPNIVAENFSTNITSLAFSPDSKLLAMGTSGRVLLADLSRPEGVPTSLVLFSDVFNNKNETTITASVSAMAFSPDGKMLAAGITVSLDRWGHGLNLVKVVRLEDHGFMVAYSDPPEYVSQMSWSADGVNLAVATGAEVHVYTPLTPASRPFVLKFGSGIVPGSVTSLGFSPDGSRLAVAHGDEVRIFRKYSLAN